MSCRFLNLAAALAAAALRGACASDYSFSLLYGTRYHRATIDTYPLGVSRVDGRSRVC